MSSALPSILTGLLLLIGTSCAKEEPCNPPYSTVDTFILRLAEPWTISDSTRLFRLGDRGYIETIVSDSAFAGILSSMSIPDTAAPGAYALQYYLFLGYADGDSTMVTGDSVCGVCAYYVLPSRHRLTAAFYVLDGSHVDTLHELTTDVAAINLNVNRLMDTVVLPQWELDATCVVRVSNMNRYYSARDQGALPFRAPGIGGVLERRLGEFRRRSIISQGNTR